MLSDPERRARYDVERNRPPGPEPTPELKPEPVWEPAVYFLCRRLLRRAA